MQRLQTLIQFCDLKACTTLLAVFLLKNPHSESSGRSSTCCVRVLDLNQAWACLLLTNPCVFCIGYQLCGGLARGSQDMGTTKEYTWAHEFSYQHIRQTFLRQTIWTDMNIPDQQLIIPILFSRHGPLPCPIRACDTHSLVPC